MFERKEKKQIKKQNRKEKKEKRRIKRRSKKERKLKCDGFDIDLPKLQGIVVLNIASYMGGTNFV